MENTSALSLASCPPLKGGGVGWGGGEGGRGLRGYCSRAGWYLWHTQVPRGVCVRERLLCSLGGLAGSSDAASTRCAWRCACTRSANGNDGPKWTCGIQVLKPPCVIFSLGCNNVIDFESEMYKWGHCTIHVFDPTVDGSIAPSLKQQANATLHLLGLGTPGTVRGPSGRHVCATVGWESMCLLRCAALCCALCIVCWVPSSFSRRGFLSTASCAPPLSCCVQCAPAPSEWPAS
jgi:hypothetical protein